MLSGGMENPAVYLDDDDDDDDNGWQFGDGKPINT
jgi:hypothetical protein